MQKVSQRMPTKVLLKTFCPTGLKGNVVRFVLVPNFEVIGGIHGFKQLLPHLLDLRPALLCIKATDIWNAKYDSVLRDALLTLSDNLSCWALFDRLAESGFQQVNGFRGFVDPSDGRVKTGIILVPESVDNSDSSHPSAERVPVAASCNPALINVPWVSPVFIESMAGYALQRAGYTKILERDGKKYLAAMPNDHYLAEIIVVDTIGGGEGREAVEGNQGRHKRKGQSAD
jgi:hypothetical protein